MAVAPDLYQPLAKFLFAIGLIGFGQRNGTRIVYSYEDEGFADIRDNLESADSIYVHPAFRSALSTSEKSEKRAASSRKG